MNKVDIRDFQCHKNVNFCNNFIGCKIRKVYGNTILLHLWCKIQPMRKSKKKFGSNPGIWHIKIFVMTQDLRSDVFHCKSDSTITNVSLSVTKTYLVSESSLSTIEPIHHQAYQPSSLSKIKPIDYKAYRP